MGNSAVYFPLDSVDAYVTGYHKFGTDPVGYHYGQMPTIFPAQTVPPPLPEPHVSPPAVQSAINLNALDTISENDKVHLFRETERDPRMSSHLARLMMSEDPIEAINEDAKKAAINELDPRRFPETRGAWPVLREEIQAVRKELPRIVEEEVAKLSKEEKLALLQGASSLQIEAQPTGMGILDAVVGGVIGVGGNLLNTKIVGDIQKDIAETQAKLASQVEREKIASQEQLAREKMAIEAALEQQKIQAGLVPGVEKGLPGWVIPVAIGGIGLVALFFFLKR